MRITVDRGGDSVRLTLSEADVAETRTLADGIAADFDARGRLVALAIQEVARLTGAPDTLGELTIGLSGAASGAVSTPAAPTRSAPPSAAPSAPPPLTPAERAALGPLAWEPEAEAAMAGVPFFDRGTRRRAIVELARLRRVSTVTAAMVEETGRRR